MVGLSWFPMELKRLSICVLHSTIKKNSLWYWIYSKDWQSELWERSAKLVCYLFSLGIFKHNFLWKFFPSFWVLCHDSIKCQETGTKKQAKISGGGQSGHNTHILIKIWNAFLQIYHWQIRVILIHNESTCTDHWHWFLNLKNNPQPTVSDAVAIFSVDPSTLFFLSGSSKTRTEFC